MTEQKRRGRPPKHPAERRRLNLTFRVRDSLHLRLKALADQQQRSISEAVEAIVEEHFARGALIDDLRRVLAEQRSEPVTWRGSEPGTWREVPAVSRAMEEAFGWSK